MATINLGSLQSAKHAHVAGVIIEAIEKGAGDFEMPWHAKKGPMRRPLNAATGSNYRGVNSVTLWVESEHRGFSSHMWGTYRQWNDLGAQVRKGERSTPVLFTSLQETDPDNEEDDKKLKHRRKYVSRWYSVFNRDQVDGWDRDHPAHGPEVPLMPSAQSFVEMVGAVIRFGTNHACYKPSLDVIECPSADQFIGSSTSTPEQAYYATLLHEHIHWTGHESRLNRVFGKSMEDEVYALEELVAELGAAFLCADLQIANQPRPDHAAYVAVWLKRLKEHPLSLFIAASQAERAVMYLHDFDEMRKRAA
jgi:antirestriction protein ArdC